MRDGHLMVSIANGTYLIDKVNYVYASHSRNEIMAKAEVHIATTYIYNGESKNMLDLLNIGDQIKIFVGYNRELNEEFTGYISSIKKGFPLVISCEDEMYNLKREDVKPKSWPSTTLEEILKYIVGADKLMSGVPVIDIKPFYIKGNLSKLKVLETLKSQYGIDIYFRGGKLYAGFPYQDPQTFGKSVIYNLGYNTIEPNNLKYRRAEDVRIKVRVVSMMADNTKHETVIGDLDGELRTMHLYNISKSTIKQRSGEELKRWKFTGYIGNITAFGDPYCEHGWIAKVWDDEDPERDSGYFIDKVTLQAGVTRGIRRIADLGRRAEG